jgi:hypothetical protein
MIDTIFRLRLFFILPTALLSIWSSILNILDQQLLSNVNQSS